MELRLPALVAGLVEWLFLVVNFTLSGMNCSPEMEGTPVGEALLDLKWGNPLPVGNVEMGS